jgi:hypothetical protein
VTALPFTVNATADMAFLLEIRPKTLFFAPTGEADGRTGQNRVVLGDFCRVNDLLWQPRQKRELTTKDNFRSVANRKRNEARKTDQRHRSRQDHQTARWSVPH